MPELKNRRSAYKGQLTSVKKDLDAISRDPDKLNYTDTAELLFASRYTLNEIEKNYSESAGATKVVIEKQEGSSILDTTVGGSTNHKKLESIKIRPFNGNFSEWPTFKDLFVSLVDEDDSLKPAEKMQYLKTYITGDAQPIIDTLKVCDENYKVAWDLLVKEFDRTPLIVASYVKDFYALSGSSTATVQSIQSIQRKANAIVRALDALDVKNRDPFLIYSVLHKLDDETQAEWAKVVGKNQPTWEKFNDFLADRSYQLRMCQSEPPKITKAAPPQKTQSGKKSKTKATSLNVTEAQKCEFCEQSPHKLFRCRKFLGLDGAGRLAAVKQLKICENCLSDSHKVEHCSYSLCKFCNSKHNRLLHDVLINSNPLNLQNIPSTSGNHVTIRPWMNISNHAIPINCLVMKNITGDQPNWDVKSLKITIPNTFTLADPNWSESQPVDLLIGGQHYW
uniref:Uncharacterized protein n=1 Tax=Phlebotomus papatasi TaxID=29031 RepID=A0A1B0DLW8_PHLPP